MAGLFATRVCGGRGQRRPYEGKNFRRVGGGCVGLHDWGRWRVSAATSVAADDILETGQEFTSLNCLL
jgi:hypothetical protein